MRKYLLFIILFFLLNAFWGVSYADENDPCAGENSLLAILDRPTVGDSVCVVKPGRVVIEGGYQYQYLIGGGHGYNYPQPEIRIGLPKNNEFVFLPPNFFHQNSSGFGPASIGIKHEIGYTSEWIATVEALLTLPSGGSEFGSAGVGSAVNGIVSYNFTSTIALTSMLGVSTQTLPSSGGGQRYNSLNPDFVLTWEAIPPLQFYAEIYGQTKTAPGEGAGYNFDGGIQYLLTQSLEIDIEEGIRLSGNLGGFNHYFGVGMGVTF